jgi:hypothetical protein
MAAENKRNFWTTVPGIISGVAAIVTGLGVLIPLLLGAAAKHPNKNSASQSPPPGVTSTAGSESPTSTAGGTGSPLPSDSSPSPATTSSGSGQSSSAAVGLTANPATLNFKGTSDQTVTISNPGSTSVTIDKVVITGSNTAAFTITSTTCGDGSTVDPSQSCQVTLHFTTPGLGSTTAALEIHYHPPQSSFTAIQLKGGGLLG